MSNEPITLGDCLLDTVARTPEQGILTIDSRGARESLSYAALHERALSELGRLQAAGLTPGCHVILQLGSTRRFLEVLWACVLGRFVSLNVARAPSYRETNGVTDKLHNVWRSLDRPRIVCDGTTEPDLRAFFELYAEPDRCLLNLDAATRAAPGVVAPARPRDVVFLQLTSGSTGVPKAIQMTHEGLVAHARYAIRHNGFVPEDITMNWLAMDHVGPMVSYHFKDTVLGCKQIHADTAYILADPLRWLDVLHEQRVTHSWSPNFGYKLLVDAYEARGDRARTWDLRRVRRLMNGGEQVTIPVMQRVIESFGQFGLTERVLQPAFGMAEACTCVTYNNDFSFARSQIKATVRGLGAPIVRGGAADSAFVDLGPVLPGVEIRIADASNTAVAEDVVGRLQIRGKVVTPGYLNHPEANAEAFVGGGWFNSGDLGFLHDGHLFLVGREKETIIIRGANWFCHELEEHVGRTPGVLPTYVAATSVPDELAGTESLVVFFVPDRNYVTGTTESEIEERLTSAFGVSPSAVIAVSRAELAKTTSGKIQRAQMRADYLAGRIRARLGHATTPERVWVAANSAPPSAARLKQRHAIVLAEPDGVATQLPFGSLDLVVRGSGFARGTGRFTVAETSEADLARVLEEVRAARRDQSPLTIVFAWELGEGESWLRVVVPVMRALARSAVPFDELFVVGRRLLHCGAEPDINVHAQVAATYMHAASLELPDVRFRVVDLEQCLPGLRRRVLTSELSDTGGACEVAYRQAGRLVARTAPAAVDNSVLFEPCSLGLGPGSIVISGGLGGLGRQLTRAILRALPEARVLLVGRSARTIDATDWPGVSAPELRRLAYRQADFADPSELLGALGDDELAAVFHLAGTVRTCAAAEESVTTVEAIQHAKSDVGPALEALAARSPGCLIVAVSSTAAHLVEPRMAAYSSASRGLEATIARLAARGVRACSVSLGPFAGVGMNASAEGLEFRRAQGYTLLEPEQLWQAIQLQCMYPARKWLFGAPTARPAELERAEHGLDDALGDAALRSLLQVFSEVTGRKADRSSLQRTFFELGVDSLRLTRFRHELERRFAVDVPMSVLYRCNTIERLHREVIAPAGQPAAAGAACTAPAITTSTRLDVPLLKLVTGTDPKAAPLLLVPPAGGVVAPYHDFLSALSRERDVWAFEDPYVHDTSGPELDVGPLLERVSRNVLATLTRAPIVIAYSAGGTLAWALTEALNDRGLPPPLVVLIDTYLIEHPRLLADTMHTLSLAVDGGWPAVAVQALFHTVRALSIPVPSGTRKVLSHSVMRRNSTLQNLFETHRFYHRWADAPTGDTAWRDDFEDSLDELCKIVQRSDPSVDLSRFRQIFKHACILSPRRTLSFVPRPLTNKVALFEVDKSGLTIKDLIGRYTKRMVLHERVAVPSYQEVRKDYFRFRQSSALTKHFICMYDPHFVKTVVSQLNPLIASI